MRLVCEECKKVYDYDVDDFCPRCGAYNPPKKTWGIDSKGNVVRVDGVNEANHKGSFVHKEVHKEKWQRRVTGMDRDALPKRQPQRPVSRPGRAAARKPAGKKQEGTAVGVLIAIVFLVQLLRSCAGLF